MLNLCLNTNESKPIYAFKRFVQQKSKPVEMQTFLLMENGPSFFPGLFLMYF